ncbi:hypothetical protein [Limnothrix sp. FACHB-881]|nr:hypothetical protein [Limnothrix sp. FACHB-881]
MVHGDQLLGQATAKRQQNNKKMARNQAKKWQEIRQENDKKSGNEKENQ